MKKLDKEFILNNFFIVVFTITFACFWVGYGIYNFVSDDAKSVMEEVTTELYVEETTPEPETDSKGKIIVRKEEETSAFIQGNGDYLDGALFIGDSRTMTLSLYSGWKKTHFYVKQGVSIWGIMDAKVVKSKGKTITIRRALKKNKFDKIYIMLGINELGTGSSEDFYNQYKKVIKEIKQYQPNAIIYIQSIIHVSSERDAKKDHINNNAVNVRNQKIKKLADGKQIFWIDLNKLFDDKKGALDKKYTSDGVHIIPKYIPKWKDYLLSHVADSSNGIPKKKIKNAKKKSVETTNQNNIENSTSKSTKENESTGANKTN